MDTISSAAFRKTYAKLTGPVEVTVHDHVIGTFWPSGWQVVGQRIAPAAAAGLDLFADERMERLGASGATFSTRPFTPVPKKR